MTSLLDTIIKQYSLEDYSHDELILLTATLIADKEVLRNLLKDNNITDVEITYEGLCNDRQRL